MRLVNTTSIKVGDQLRVRRYGQLVLLQAGE